ncbi:MAG: carbohydrate-binding protein [Acidobacteria bacterium RIFCSPLOWO2_02_FULL_67_36]|nr:MAG: carbohydrate-binding protein [Acidobacteria bacterium RIFCSPLOWO2_02_FULL_67_36]OFW25558.1 MAG: carbohydrate-binding protein [Acidobacteria bacterium RIFCSPLOWO2_12_FULL_66_21]
MLAPVLFALFVAQGQGDMAVSASTTLEQRPAAARLSPLQPRVDAAAPGSVIDVAAGTYTGDLYIDRPVRLVGHGRPLLVGSGSGSVVLVRAADVVVEGFDIDGRAGGDLGRDSSGIHIAAPRAIIRDCRVRNSIFGIYLREANGSRVERCRIDGIPGKSPGEKGSGLHVWNTDGFELLHNEIVDVRDGIYIQSSPHGVVRGNVARDLRYGLHYMYSDDNTFEDNVFENGAAGTTLMYSRRITFRHNQFIHNRGFASVGLLFKNCDDIVAESNLIADNARGIFLEGSSRNVFRGNLIAASDIAIVLYDSTSDTRFTGNSFVGNLTPLSLSGRRTDTIFADNYWSGNESPDLDGDGRSDQPYRLSSLFDHLRGNLTAADLVSRSLAASAVAAAEQALPVLDPIPVVDASPRSHPPVLDVPTEWRNAEVRRAPIGLLASAALTLVGALPFAAGRRRRVVLSGAHA